MGKITAEDCIKLIKQNFPDFIPYWEDYIRDFGEDNGLIVQMLPFGKYTIEIINSENYIHLKRIFDFVEYLICEGDDYVQTALTTSYLEYLMSKDPDEIQFSKFAKYLGENSIEYCRAWDEFTGVRTKGLWEEKTE
jgi:hypothetical protein